MRELPGGGYPERTIANVRDADATLIIHFGPITGGTRLTVEACERLGRPYELVDAEIGMAGAAERATALVRERRVGVLNVAGPRESGAPGARAFTARVIAELLVTLSAAARRAGDSGSAVPR